MRERRFYVYIMASPSGTLYVGVTNSIARRNSEHRNGLHPTSFTARYGCRKLVYYEEHGSIRVAIDREKQIKRWRREKKESLIRSINPGWQNLSHVWRE
jgi:putative endonuclease